MVLTHKIIQNPYLYKDCLFNIIKLKGKNKKSFGLETKKMKYKATKRIGNLGSSWCIILPKKILEAKGYALGDLVEFELGKTTKQDYLDLQKLANKKMEQEDVQSIAITEDGIFGELKKEDSDDDIDNELPKD